MQAWELYTLLGTFGALLFLCGYAQRAPTPRINAISIMSAGGLFLIVAFVGSLVGRLEDLIPFTGADQRHLFALGAAFISIGTMLACYVAYSYFVERIPPLPGELPWIRWVYTAWFIWVVFAGIVMVRAATRH
jgi:hypothetical protein